MHGDARSRKTPMIGTTAQLGLLAGVTVLLWSTAPGAPERFLTALVGAVLAIGVVGRYGASRESSRLPPVAQGVLVGGLIGALVTVIALGELHTWVLLGFLLALPPLFPRVVPARWRPMATATWSDWRPRASHIDDVLVSRPEHRCHGSGDSPFGPSVTERRADDR